jgi:hypothetical protein
MTIDHRNDQFTPAREIPIASAAPPDNSPPRIEIFESGVAQAFGNAYVLSVEDYHD